VDIHAVAERYLQDIQSGKIEFYAREHKPELVHRIKPVVERVVVVREEAPHYLAGVKPSGRLVWTHCMRLAASYNHPSAVLGSVLERLDVYQIPVDTMPACWFSNHQER
jgi:hypothetical protein